MNLAEMKADVRFVMSLIRDAERGSVEAGEEIERIEFASLYGARTVRAARRSITINNPRKAKND